MFRVYFVSKRRLKEKEEIRPRVPDNRLTRSGREDNKISRICVSNSIQGCLDSTNIFVDRKLFYLYYVDLTDEDIKYIKQLTDRQVSDSKFTGELWLTKPTKFKLLHILHVKRYNINKEYTKYVIKDKDSIGLFSISKIVHN